MARVRELEEAYLNHRDFEPKNSSHHDRRASRRLKFGLPEVFPDVQYLHSGRPGDGVSEAVPHVETRRMPPFSVSLKRVEEYRDVIAGERNHHGLNLRQKLVHQRRTITSRFAAELSRFAAEFYCYDHLRLGHRWRADGNSPGQGDLAEQIPVTRLTADHSDHRR